VVITGLGAIAPNGIGKEAFWHALSNGRSGIDRITHFDASAFPSQIAGTVKHFQPTHYMAAREAKRMSRVSQFGIAAATMALTDARLQVRPDNAGTIGVCFSTSLGKAETYETEHLPFLERGYRAISPQTVVEIPPHGVSSHVAVALGVSGICGTLAMGCTSGLDVVQWGYQQICLGRAPVIVVGSAEAVLTPFIFGVVCAVGVLSKRNHAPHAASRPFDKDRDGLVLSEGAGALVLESWEHARERQAPLYAEVLGCAGGRDGEDLVRCDLSGTGMAQVMGSALYQAGLPGQRLDYISAHGVGLRDYDVAETNAIKTVLGSHAYNIPVSSIKSMIGQPFAAAGSLQTVAACLTLQAGVLPPTLNCDTPDPCCDLDYVPHRARRARVQTLLVHAHGMGGTDSALVLGKVLA
jgi:3-oxoacyl-[acyl-carrier-protein] synthase II